jgi:hypothetical protein
MNSFPLNRVRPGEVSLRLQPRKALRLERASGELTVLQGRAWLTLSNQHEDHFLDAGQRMALGCDDFAVVESALAGQLVNLRWVPARRGFVAPVLSAPLRAAAYLLGAAAEALAALADLAALTASRTQGRAEDAERWISLRQPR